MKKLISSIIVLAMLLCSAALAVEIGPMVPDFGLANDTLEDGEYNVAFLAEDVTKDGIYMAVFSQDLYDAVEVSQLHAGDTIVAYGETIEIETIEDAEGSVIINGGEENENGVILFAGEGGTYYTMNFEYPCFTVDGEIELPMADTVTLSVYCKDIEGNPTGEMDTSDMTVEQVVNTIHDMSADEDFGQYFVPDNTVVTVSDGKIIGITVNYMP